MTQTQTDARGKRVIDRTIKGLHLEVFEAKGETGGYAYVGYCDGERSVVATRADIAARGLERKHIAGLPEGKVIDFAAERARRRERKTLH